MESKLGCDLNAPIPATLPVLPSADRREQQILRMYNDIFDQLAATETAGLDVSSGDRTLLLE
jgi:hypothetical protein